VVRLYAVLATFAIIPAAAAEPNATTRPTEVQAKAPVEPKPRPQSVTLPQGTAAVALSFEVGVAKGSALEPMSVAPDLSVGITDSFQLSAISSGSALTGFRGSAGWGYCLSDEKCRASFAAAGVEGLVSLTRGSAALAANLGVVWSSLEPTVHTDVKVGFKLKLSEGNVYALMSPSVWIAADDRSDPVVPHEHQLFVPISFWYKPAAKLALGVGTGVKGPLENFEQRLAIPGGALVQVALDPQISVGGSFVFGKLLAGSEVMDPGIDARAVQLWTNVTSR
jgi:hypothetical protein